MSASCMPLAGLGFHRPSCSLMTPKSKIDATSVPATVGDSTSYINQSGKSKRRNSLASKVPECLFGEIQEESGSGKSEACNLKDDELLISAFLRNKTFKSHPSKRKSLGRSCKLAIRRPNKSREHLEKEKPFIPKRKTVLSWLLHSGFVSHREVIQYRNQKNDVVVKEGTVTRSGILCKCCIEVFSISEFMSHAGFRRNSPCLNLYMESGKPFALCQLEAWSVEYKSRKAGTQAVQIKEMNDHDDKCGRCGDFGVSGDFICCYNCSSIFHLACLYLKEIPQGDWYCPQCTCQICGTGVNCKQALGLHGAQCRQCENRYHEACIQQGLRSNVASDAWFCSNSCQEVYIGLQAQIGFVNWLSDGHNWSLLKCIDGDQKAHSALRFLALKADCNTKLAVALTIMEKCFGETRDHTAGVDLIPQLVYNWSSKYARVNYTGFYTMVLQEKDTFVALASIRIHGVKVAEIPFVATSEEYRRQGMCRRLFNAIEHMLKALKVEKLVISAVPSTVETWKAGFGFESLRDEEKQSLSNINLMACLGTEYLMKPLFRTNKADSNQGLDIV